MVRGKDPFWQYGEDLKGHFTCKFCKCKKSGGISRLKAHLSCLPGMDVVGCTLVPEDVQAEAVLLVKEKEHPNKKLKTGGVQHEGTHHDFSALRQTTVPSMCDKKDKEHVDHALGHFFFDNNIAFNVIQSQSFIDFCIALSNYGSGFKVPSYSTLRTKLVQNAKAEVVEYVSQVKNSWSQIGSGCTLMSDGWTDLKGRCFINMIVYSPKGAVFLYCIEESSERKTAVYLKNLLCNAIEEIGAENVVQIITDNASNCESAGQMVMEVYPHIYKTRCATHGVQLLLKDINDDIGWIRGIFQEAKVIVDFLYRFPAVTALLRSKTSKELKKPCTTRFAYHFLMLQSIIDVEDGLRAMVASPNWRALKQCNDVRGRQVTDIIQGIVFWDYGKEVISVLEPLIRVLRLVDGEGSTAGYLFEAMERAREEIKHRCDNDPIRYEQLWDLFDPRRDRNILHEVHALAAFLNPKFMVIERIKYGHPLVKKGLVFAATNMISNDADRRAFSTQITEYNTKSSDIFTPIANYQMETIHPRVWWLQNGGSIPIVQKIAVRILSQPCSASACERNWSAFEAAQTKKRNSLSPEMLEDLVYIRMNSKMKANCENMEKRDTKAIDLEYLGELPEYEERGNGDVDLAIPNEATGNANDATSNATPPTRDDIIFEELFGSSM